MRSVIAILACAVVLALVSVSIVGKERQLENGKIVYLELAPVDPRSLMQGDYMALRFKIADEARSALRRAQGSGELRFMRQDDFDRTDGRIVVALDRGSVATYRRLDDATPLAADEVALRYRVRNGQIKFATNAFFFQEGTARRYEAARYGEFRVAADGELLLTALRGKDLQPL